MVDTPPPNRFSVVERGGRLIVIDKETGRTPPTAAERMDIHDRKRGIEPIRPARKAATSAELSTKESGRDARAKFPAAAPDVHAKAAESLPADGKVRVAAAVARKNKQPWNDQQSDRPALKSNAANRGAAEAKGSPKTIVTGKWWDAKGPRTVVLGPRGQAELSGGFITLFIVTLIIAVVALMIEPLLLFVGAFVLFRFGGSILGPIGASLIDKALAERG